MKQYLLIKCKHFANYLVQIIKPLIKLIANDSEVAHSTQLKKRGSFAKICFEEEKK